MLKKYCTQILLLFTTLLVTPLYATQDGDLPAQEAQAEQKNNIQQPPGAIAQPDTDYYNYTLKHNKKPKPNNVEPEYLEEEKELFRENDIVDKLKNKQGVCFFMLIVSDNNTKALSKFFFFNRDPVAAPDAIRKVSKFYKCHVISHTKPMLSPHIVFQLLGWLAQEERKYTPIFIHASSPVCITCHSIALNLFNLNIPTNDKGCWGNSNIALENQCPLAQKYIKSHLTLDLAKRILLPKVAHEHKQTINRIVAENDKKIEEVRKNLSNQIKLLKSFLRNGIKEVNYSPLQGHTNNVYSVPISSDNKYIVSGSDDYTIRIWDLKTGKEMGYSPLKGHTNSVYSVAISHDNKYIVSGSLDNTIRIWDLKTGKEVKHSPLKGHTCWVKSVAISHDNKYIVSGSSDNTIRIWHIETGALLPYTPLTDHTSYVYSVAISHDNQYIVSGSGDKTIRIWDFKTGKPVDYSPLKGHTSSVLSVAISSDNRYIVSGGDDKTIRIWDLKTGKQLPYSPLYGHTSYVWSVAISSDNRYIVSGSSDHTIRIWDFKTGKKISFSPLTGHTSQVRSVAITADNGYIVSGSDDNTLRIWDIKLLQYLNEDDYKEEEEVFDID